ncbi:hypothetical protein [Candidatus Stoquefichus sp. SB1]|uniref:hypothetical protein n=1 Tax=Candidatus Stoquefichus sp. SB1 TaxID=1658109 RepID=UPI00067EBA97|nr:hypothetical protein [Candidatus Stoquefichus sp. SB1]
MQDLKISSTFFEEIKNDCGVTWDNAKTNTRINGIVSNAIDEFQEWFGKDVDVEHYGNIRKMFMAYVRYHYYDQGEDFKKNYASDILNERMKYEVTEYEKSKQANVS